MQLPIVLLSLLSIASAAPASLSPRAEATCGSVYYSASAVNAASQAACSHFRAGTTVGSNSYPHRYNNFEGFNFGGVASPYQEFPIMSSGSIYTGGSPGPDRVVINEASCKQAGTITHTGASGNNFVACKGTS